MPGLSMHRSIGPRGACAEPSKDVSWLQSRADRRARFALGERVLHRPARQLGATAQAGLLADTGQVVLHGARRDVQLLRDLLVRAAAGDQAQDLVLALAQERADVGGLAARRARVLLEQMAGEHRRDDRAAAVDRDDRLSQLLARRALREVAGGAGRDRVEQRLRLLGRRHHEHLRLRRLGAQALEDGHSAHLRHAQVEDHHVGLQLARQAQAVLTIVGLTDNGQTGIRFQRGGKAFANQRKIIDQQNSDVHASPQSASVTESVSEWSWPCQRSRRYEASYIRPDLPRKPVISVAGRAFPKRYPCAISQPGSVSAVTCARDSTPSATTVRPRACERLMSAETMRELSGVSRLTMNERSILSRSIGSRLR